jgi:hypothetical protein
MFYRLQRDANARRQGLDFARIAEYADPGIPWFAGQRAEGVVPTPVRCVLDAERGGPDMPDLFLSQIPLFSTRLLECLRQAGVDNLEVYDAELLDPRSQRVNRSYKAVNIVGKVQCVNLAESEFDPRSQYPMLEFRRIVLDEAKIGELRLFRLAENPLFILMDEGVKSALADAPLVGVQAASLAQPSAY